MQQMMQLCYMTSRFAILRQGDPINLKWNHINSEFYLDALSLGLTNKMKTAEQQLFLCKSKPNTKSEKKFICYDFNNDGKCSRKNCRYGHCCQHCGGPTHAKIVDNGWQNPRFQNRWERNPAIPQQTSEKHLQMLPKNNLDIVTPVKVVELRKWLKGYDQDKSIFLVEGLTNGFQIPYVGEFSSEMSVCRPKDYTRNSDILTKYIEKELQAGRIAGPFHTPPPLFQILDVPLYFQFQNIQETVFA